MVFATAAETLATEKILGPLSVSERRRVATELAHNDWVAGKRSWLYYGASVIGKYNVMPCKQIIIIALHKKKYGTFSKASWKEKCKGFQSITLEDGKVPTQWFCFLFLKCEKFLKTLISFFGKLFKKKLTRCNYN